MAAYWEEHAMLLVDPVARSPKRMQIQQGKDVWTIVQTLADPEEHDDWKLDLKVNLEASREAGTPVLEFVALGS